MLNVEFTLFSTTFILNEKVLSWNRVFAQAKCKIYISIKLIDKLKKLLLVNIFKVKSLEKYVFNLQLLVFV